MKLVLIGLHELLSDPIFSLYPRNILLFNFMHRYSIDMHKLYLIVVQHVEMVCVTAQGGGKQKQSLSPVRNKLWIC